MKCLLYKVFGVPLPYIMHKNGTASCIASAVRMCRSCNMMLSQVINNYLCCAIKVITVRGYIRRMWCTDFSPGWLCLSGIGW
jgi:hypothetical protein